MTTSIGRRDAIKQLSAAAAALALPAFVLRLPEPLVVAGQQAELTVSPVSAMTVRLTIRAISNTQPIPFTGALARDEFGRVVTRTTSAKARAKVGNLVVTLTSKQSGPTITVETNKGALVQRLVLDAAAPGMTFLLPTGPLLAMGEGGAQFDRKGIVDQKERPERVRACNARHTRSGAVAHRHGRLGDVHSSTVRRLRPDRH